LSKRITISKVDLKSLDEITLYVLSYLKKEGESHPYQIADYVAKRMNLDLDGKKRMYFKKVYMPKKMQEIMRKGFLKVRTSKSEHKSHLNAHRYSLKSDLFISQNGYLIIVNPFGIQICHDCESCPLSCPYKPYFLEALKRLRGEGSVNGGVD